MSQTSPGGGEDNWTNWLFGISLLFTLGSAGYFGHQGSFGTMCSAIAAGALGMAFCRLSRISRFVANLRSGSIELETMQREIEENTATIERIKSLAIAVYRPILGLLASGGRADLAGLESQIIDHLRAMGATEEEIEYTRSEMIAWKTWDHAQHIEWACRERSSEAQAELDELKNADQLFVSEPSAYRQTLERLELMDQYTEAAIQDYEWFLEHKQLRRPDRFIKMRRELERMDSNETSEQQS